jgi:hypothetical protein
LNKDKLRDSLLGDADFEMKGENAQEYYDNNSLDFDEDEIIISPAKMLNDMNL